MAQEAYRECQETQFLYAAIAHSSNDHQQENNGKDAHKQRAYDFFGYEWRMPLWDGEILDFWKGVPLQYKLDQKLYKEVLSDNNWGEVWKDIPVNHKLIRPYFLLIFRFFVKLIVSPFGKNNWHKLERRIFTYWVHPSYAQAVTSFKDVLFDMHGHRNASSWLSKQYIKKIGFKSIDEVSKKVKSITS